MKIRKIAQYIQPQTIQPTQQQPTQPAPQQTQQPQTTQQSQQQPNNPLQQINPQVKTLINQAITGSGISRQKALQLVQGLMAAMGEVPLSKVKATIETMAAEEVQSANAVQQPDQGVAQQTDQTMVPQSG